MNNFYLVLCVFLIFPKLFTSMYYYFKMWKQTHKKTKKAWKEVWLLQIWRKIPLPIPNGDKKSGDKAISIGLHTLFLASQTLAGGEEGKERGHDLNKDGDMSQPLRPKPKGWSLSLILYKTAPLIPTNLCPVPPCHWALGYQKKSAPGSCFQGMLNPAGQPRRTDN